MHKNCLQYNNNNNNNNNNNSTILKIVHVFPCCQNNDVSVIMMTSLPKFAQYSEGVDLNPGYAPETEVVSSALFVRFILISSKSKLQMKILRKRCSDITPCGTPDSTLLYSLNKELILTLRIRLLK